jgi:hypothetical protein
MSDTEIVFCGGNVDPDDRSHDSKIVAVDDGIIAWLERRERRRKYQKFHLNGCRQHSLSGRGSRQDHCCGYAQRFRVHYQAPSMSRRT